jgi:hypothetical protein
MSSAPVQPGMEGLGHQGLPGPRTGTSGFKGHCGVMKGAAPVPYGRVMMSGVGQVLHAQPDRAGRP